MTKKIFLSLILSSVLFSMEHSHNNHKHHQHNTKMQETTYDEKDIKLSKKGKKIFETICNKDDFKKFESKDSAKEFLKLNCKSLNDEKLEAVASYLYLPNLASDTNKMITIPKDAKCPVCGMFVGNFQNWVSMIEINNKQYYFDGVKDMLKFYFEPNKYIKNTSSKQISQILVTDYFTLEAIDAKNAYYVFGSNVYGPMGKELIPFKNEKAAKEFLKDHFAKKVLRFDELSKDYLE